MQQTQLEVKVPSLQRPGSLETLELELESGELELEELSLPGSLTASTAATAIHGCLQVCYFAALIVNCIHTKDMRLFCQLLLIQISLCFDAGLYAVGGLVPNDGRARAVILSALATGGRVRLLGSVVAWAWLVPWAAEVSCRCRTTPISNEAAVGLLHGNFVATCICGFFGMRELCFLLRGEPPSALDSSVAPKFGDCLPSNALLGGQFRLSKVDLEETGRAIFVPSRERKGLYFASGIALLSHLMAGSIIAGRTGTTYRPWWLLGAVMALACRQGASKLAEGASCQDRFQREIPRILCSLGELLWISCAMLQLHRCEADPSGWQQTCEVPT